jgi:hypothetical protein
VRTAIKNSAGVAGTLLIPQVWYGWGAGVWGAGGAGVLGVLGLSSSCSRCRQGSRRVALVARGAAAARHRPPWRLPHTTASSWLASAAPVGSPSLPANQPPPRPSAQEPFELLVRRSISRLLAPSLQCKECVYEELLKIAELACPR